MHASKESNLKDVLAVRENDSTFSKLHGVANWVTVYRYNSSTHSWKRTDISGDMYLYERNAMPQYGLAVINSRNKHNFRQEFGPDAMFVMHQPYLLIRVADDLRFDINDDTHTIHCIWFYDAKHCLDSANILRDIMGLKFEGEGEALDKVVGGKTYDLCPFAPLGLGSHAGNNLFQILRTAKKEESDDEFQEKETKIPLDKGPFCQALVHLLQNDANFLSRIHECYKTALLNTTPDESERTTSAEHGMDDGRLTMMKTDNEKRHDDYVKSFEDQAPKNQFF